MNITNNTVLIDEEFMSEYFLAGTWSVWGLWLKKGDMDSAVMGVMRDSRMTNVVVIEKYTGMRSAKVDGVPQNLINSIFAVDDGIRRFEREQRNSGEIEIASVSRARPRPRVETRYINTPTAETREVSAETWVTWLPTASNAVQQQSEPENLHEAGRRASNTIRSLLNDLNENQNDRSTQSR